MESTYIGNTLCGGLHPTHWDIYTQDGVPLFHILHLYHKVFGFGKDQCIDVGHKLDYLGILHQSRIHLFWL